MQPANCTGVRTHGHRYLTLDLGLNRTPHCVFIITDVPYPVIGIHFFQHFDLFFDARHRKMVDPQTLLTTTGSYAVVNQITLNLQPNTRTKKYFETTRACCDTPVHLLPSLLR